MAWLPLGVQVSIDQRWKLTPPQSEQNPTWAQKRREKQTADTTTSQIITQFHKCLQCWTTHAKTLFFTTLSWAVLGAVPHSPGLADSHCSLQETPLYGWACSFKSERETYLCAVYEIWQPREKCWSSVFTHLNKLVWCHQISHQMNGCEYMKCAEAQ